MNFPHITRRRALALAASAAASTLAPIAAHAQGTFATKPISILVGLQSGTGSDVAVRVLAEKLGATLRQPVVVENLPGAGGQLAALRGVKMPPDGHFLVALSSATVTSLPAMNPSVGFDPLRDLVPVAMVATIPSVFFVRTDFPAKSLPEFVAAAKAGPGKFTYASGGNGSVQHIGMEIFKSLTGIAVVHIPYKGSGQATLDVAGGRVDSGLQGVSTVLPFLKTGKLRALASTGDTRTVLLPDLPTVRELGLGNFLYEPWTALYAPAGTPPEVVAALNAAVRRIAAEPEFKARFESLGLSASDDTVAGLAARLKADHSSMGAIVRAKNITAD